jgi:hypothetical protein
MLIIFRTDDLMRPARRKAGAHLSFTILVWIGSVGSNLPFRSKVGKFGIGATFSPERAPAKVRNPPRADPGVGIKRQISSTSSRDDPRNIP